MLSRAGAFDVLTASIFRYSAFLSQHGGSSNAYTAAENTNYQFQITPEYFAPALDIFAQFFVAPLLKADSTVREVRVLHNGRVLPESPSHGTAHHMMLAARRDGASHGRSADAASALAGQRCGE